MFLNTTFPRMYFNTVCIFFLIHLKKLINYSQLNFTTCRFKTTEFQYFNLIFIFKKHSLTKINSINDICVSDYPNNLNKRFFITYILSSVKLNFKYQISLWVTEYTGLLSLSQLFKGVIWLEREIWDFFGIFFQKNKDLRRILTDYGFKGYPLRKDFPLVGFLEVYYNFQERRILYRPCIFSQGYRTNYII